MMGIPPLKQQARAKGQPTGKLGGQLKAQKKQTRNETLKQGAAEEVRRREMDANAQAMSHD